MAVNKLVIDDVVELDLTTDTVTADTLTEGVTAHDASGVSITGTLNPSPVTSFNGRIGAVIPQTGDYSYYQLDDTPDVADYDTNGLMSSTDKSKLDGIEDGANKTVIDTEVTASSTNAVSGWAVYEAIENRVNSLLPTILTDTLPQGETTLVFEDSSISDNSSIYVETSVWNVYPTSAVQTSNSVEFTFEVQSIDLTVKVYVCED